jgi:hypothetical protein
MASKPKSRITLNVSKDGLISALESNKSGHANLECQFHFFKNAHTNGSWGFIGGKFEKFKSNNGKNVLSKSPNA